MRRNATARRRLSLGVESRWVGRVGNLFSRILRILRVRAPLRNHLRSAVDRKLRAMDHRLIAYSTKVYLVAEQKVTGGIHFAYKATAKFSTNPSWRISWRCDLPEMYRYEVALGGIVDALRPDLIHVHDVFHIGLATRAKLRASADNRSIRVVYDAHEFVPGLPIDLRRRNAYTDLEAEYIKHVDGVITVSPQLADALASRHGVTPRVVMNVPDLNTSVVVESARSVLGLRDDEHMVVYVGGLAPHRGAELMIDAISQLPSTLLVLIVGSVTPYVQGLMDSVAAAGLGDIVHTLPFVAPEAVVSYLSQADVSIIALSRDVPNYEFALPNKLFQSIHAGVPVVVSDNPAMAAFVTKYRVGEVFEGGNVESLVQGIRTVLANPEPYRRALEDSDLLKSITWASQAQILFQLYRELGVEAL